MSIPGYDAWKLASPDDEADRYLSEDDDVDEYEEAMANCSQFVDGGFIYCGAVGSEQCDECPFQCDLGKSEAELIAECESQAAHGDGK